MFLRGFFSTARRTFISSASSPILPSYSTIFSPYANTLNLPRPSPLAGTLFRSFQSSAFTPAYLDHYNRKIRLLISNNKSVFTELKIADEHFTTVAKLLVDHIDCDRFNKTFLLDILRKIFSFEDDDLVGQRIKRLQELCIEEILAANEYREAKEKYDQCGYLLPEEYELSKPLYDALYQAEEKLCKIKLEIFSIKADLNHPSIVNAFNFEKRFESPTQRRMLLSNIDDNGRISEHRGSLSFMIYKLQILDLKKTLNLAELLSQKEAEMALKDKTWTCK